jgi:lysophospholipase L1-like esterase
VKVGWIILLVLLLIVIAVFLAGVIVGSRKIFPYYQVRALTEGLSGHVMFLEDTELPNLLLLGDSLIARGDWRSLEEQWDILNYGKGGRLLSELNGTQDALPLNESDAIIIWCGVNDLNRRTAIPKLIEDYSDLLKNVTDREIKVVVFSIPYVRGVNQSSKRESAKQCNQELKRLCKEYGAEYLNVNAFLSGESGLLEEYSRDGLHLTLAGYKLITTEVSRLLQLSLPKNNTSE